MLTQWVWALVTVGHSRLFHNLMKNFLELPPELCDVHVNLLHEAEGRLDVPFRHEYVGHLVLELLVHMRLGELEHEVPLLRRRLKIHPSVASLLYNTQLN